MRNFSSAYPSSLGALVAAITVCLWTAKAHGAGPLGPDGTPITTSNYAVDLFSGPVFAGSRVTGLAGAYVAIAEDVDGDLQNPATPAVRPFYSYSHFDYWLGFGLTFPATLKDLDIFNSGSKTRIANDPDSFVFFVPAVNLQWGELGVGITFEVQRYAISGSTNASASGGTELYEPGVSVSIPTTHLQVAHGYDHNQWVLGAGLRFVSLSLIGPDRRRASFKSSGTGVEVGMVWKPENRPLRVGVAFRSAIRTEASYRETLLPDENGDLVVTGPDGTPLYLPKSVAFPWDVNFGFAIQFGGRPFNPPWRTSEELVRRKDLENELRQYDRVAARNRDRAHSTTSDEMRQIDVRFEREREADERRLARAVLEANRSIARDLVRMNRFYVQVAASTIVSGPVDQSVGVESLISQTVTRSGQRAVISPRIGTEVGILPTFLKLRGGTYVEPSRFDDVPSRLHGTLGLDVKLFPWNVFGMWPDDYMWRLGLGADVASRYAMWGVTLGGWYPRHKRESEVPPLGPETTGAARTE